MSNLGDDLIEAMQEAAAYMEGDPGKTVTSTVDVPDVDVAAIRRTMKLSRIKFANRFGLDARAVRIGNRDGADRTDRRASCCG